MLMGGQRVCASRDFPAELDRANRLVGLLNLPPGDSELPFTTLVKDADCAADLLLALTDPALGLEVYRPEGARARTVRPADAEDLGLHLRAGRDWFDVKGGVTVDEVHVPIARLLELLRSGRRTVPVDANTLIYLSESLRRTLARLADVAHCKRAGVRASGAGACAGAG